jgi:predicted regulator of Ras-like GTPase activity (Roadblock/LC7/MglB family)
MSEMKKILENLCRFEGVKGALIVGRDGKIIESFTGQQMDLEVIGNLIVRSIEKGDAIGEKIGISSLNQAYIEYPDMNLTSEVLGPQGVILTILAGSGANLGRIRLEIRKNRKAVESLLN